MKLKHFILPLGSLLVIPVVSLAASCNEQESPEVAPGATLFSQNLTQNGKELTVADDGLYLLPGTYGGKLWSGTRADGAELAKAPYALPAVQSLSFAGSAYEFGPGDSVYLLFDNDDADGISVASFEQNFFIYDTGNPARKAIDDLNKSYGNVIDPFNRNGNLWVSFKNGLSNAAITQTKATTLTHDAALSDVSKAVSADAYQAVQDYYKRASKIFKPFVLPKGLFTAEQVAKNAIRITLSADSPTNFGLEAAGFILVNTLDAQNTNAKVNRYEEFAFGALAWKAYEDNERPFTLLKPS